MISVVLSPFIVWHFLRLSRQASLASLLAKSVLRKVRCNDFAHSEDIHDLQTLGEWSEPGFEKQTVLDKLAVIARSMQRNSRYMGYDLSETLSAVEGVVCRGKSRGDNSNFSRSISLIIDVMRRLHEVGLASSPDMGTAIRTLQRIGFSAIESDTLVAVPNKAIDALTLPAELSPTLLIPVLRSLEDLGAETLGKGRSLAAVAILNRMEALVDARENSDTESEAIYLGLIAHFWTAGLTAKARATQGLSQRLDAERLPECLDRAQRYHTLHAGFLTADKIAAMLADLS